MEARTASRMGVSAAAARPRLPAVGLLLGASWLMVSAWKGSSNYAVTYGFALWRLPSASDRVQQAAAPVDEVPSQGRRALVGVLGAASLLPASAAHAFETYADSKLGFSMTYPNGLQKAETDKYDFWARDLLEPLEGVIVKVTETKRRSLDDVGTPEEVAKLLVADNVPEKAPREIIKVESKVKGGVRFDYVEFAYQWKFDPQMAQKTGRKRFQLHQKAVIVIDRKKQYVVLVAAEEDRWNIQGESPLVVAIKSFALLFA